MPIGYCVSCSKYYTIIVWFSSEVNCVSVFSMKKIALFLRQNRQSDVENGPAAAISLCGPVPALPLAAMLLLILLCFSQTVFASEKKITEISVPDHGGTIVMGSIGEP